MNPIRTRDDIFAAINCRIVELDEGRSVSATHAKSRSVEQVIDHAITAAARIIRVIEVAVKHQPRVKDPATGLRKPYGRPAPH